MAESIKDKIKIVSELPSVQKLQVDLYNLPAIIRHEQEKAIEAKEIYEKEKSLYELEYSIQIKASEAKNATEKKAEAIETCGKQKVKVIDSMIKMEKANADLKVRENKFVMLRKVLSTEHDLMNINKTGN